MRTYEGTFEGRGLRVAIVASRFNENIVKSLVEGASDCLRRHGVSDEDVSLAWVPGAFEIPVVARRFATSGDVNAVVCLGVVIKGETAHFDFVAGGAAQGISATAQETGVPVTFGVLTTETVGQAADRAGGKMGNKGFETALAAIEMASLLQSLPKPPQGL